MSPRSIACKWDNMRNAVIAPARPPKLQPASASPLSSIWQMTASRSLPSR